MVSKTEQQINALKAQIAQLEATAHIEELQTAISSYAKEQNSKTTEAMYAVAKRFCNQVERAKRQLAKNKNE